VTELTAKLRPPYVAVIGDSDPRGPDAHRILEWAEEIGQQLARGGATVITGGLGGVMRAASRGAAGAGGETIGILPTANPGDANEYVRTPIATGLGVGRNLVVVTSADAVIAIGGRHGHFPRSALRCAWGATWSRSRRGAWSRSTAWEARASTACGRLVRRWSSRCDWPPTVRTSPRDTGRHA
jgi:uncharacterized protein (TIGR00725 family)